MSRYNYFDSLERLSVLSARAVFLSCSSARASAETELASIRQDAGRILCELERELFSDFLPPLERADISAVAHALCRIIERCADILGYKSGKNSIYERKSKEAELCIRLSQLIEESCALLRSIKHPDQLPDLVGFRKLLCDARSEHIAMQKKLSSGVCPRSAQHSLCLLGALRRELSRTFDTTVEVMLNNI